MAEFILSALELPLCLCLSPNAQKYSPYLMVQSFRVLLSIVLLVSENFQSRSRDFKNNRHGIGQKDWQTAQEQLPSYTNVTEKATPTDSNKVNDGQDATKNLQPSANDDNWFISLRQYSIFLPNLWLRKNLIVQLCFCFVIMNLALQRVLQTAIPQQTALIVDRLGTESMPWKETALWIIYKWLGAYSLLLMGVEYAREITQNYARKRLRDMVFHYVMNLSLNFHSEGSILELIQTMD
jgi:hypothetical protein